MEPRGEEMVWSSVEDEELLSAALAANRHGQAHSELSNSAHGSRSESTGGDPASAQHHPRRVQVCELSESDLAERIEIMLRKETECMPSPDYIADVQRDGMHAKWRFEVASWLLEFEEEFSITQDTIAVAVNFMDRYLSQVSTKKSIMQLLGIGAICVATKLHESYPIGMAELRDLADGAYLESDIKLMELELLRVIDWKLNPVTPQAIMNHLTQYIACPATRSVIHEDAVTFLDVVIPEYEFIRFSPSVQGVAAILCAFQTANVSPREWNAAVARFGIVASCAVFECKERMLHIFQCMCPSVLAVPANAMSISVAEANAPRDHVISPIGVDELHYDDDDDEATNPFPGDMAIDDCEEVASNGYSKRFAFVPPAGAKVAPRWAAPGGQPANFGASMGGTAPHLYPIDRLHTFPSANCNVKPVPVYTHERPGFVHRCDSFNA